MSAERRLGLSVERVEKRARRLDGNQRARSRRCDVPVTSAAGGDRRRADRRALLRNAVHDARGDDGEPANHQKYYEVVYDAIVQAGEPFKALDITGLRWVDLDTLEDYELAQRLFGHVDAGHPDRLSWRSEKRRLLLITTGRLG